MGPRGKALALGRQDALVNLPFSSLSTFPVGALPLLYESSCRISFFLTPLAASLAQQDEIDKSYLLLPPSEISRIQSVIGSQVEAFRQGNMPLAFSFAAPGIQRTFRDPETFGTMVEREYGPIFATFSFEFVEVIGTMSEPVQVVNFVGEDLTSVIAFYLMEMQPGGEWRIAGVQIAPAVQQAI